MTHTREEHLAGTIPLNILPAHACAGSAGWRPCDMAGAHDLSGRVSTSGLLIYQRSGTLVHCQ